MSYSTFDFEASLKIVGINPLNIHKVYYAWGNIDTENACCNQCGGEWRGGFIFKLKNNQFAQVTGWCDYTGWGCQDGADVEYFKTKKELKPPDGADKYPVDLNNFLKEFKEFDSV